MHHAFFVFSLPSLHDYDVRCIISRFVQDVITRQRLSFSFPEPRYCLLEFNSKKNCQKNALKFEAAQLYLLSDYFATVAIVVT